MAILRDNRERYRFLEAWVKKLRWLVAFAICEDSDRADRWVASGNMLRTIESISAPRVAGLAIKSGKDARRIRRILEAEDYALIRQSIPHDEMRGVGHERGSPVTGWCADRYTVYWPWDAAFAETNILTSDLQAKDFDIETDWVVGLGDSYEPVVFSIDPKKGSPHFFAIGSTTSGKSTSVVNMIAQLARCESNRFAFVDVAKKGNGLGLIPYMKSALGPSAWEVEDARNLLAWILDEMENRYRDQDRDRYRIVLIIDEFPSLRGDEFCVDAIERITSQGATANIHCVLIAQHAIQAAIGPFAGIIKANVSGRLCFKCGTDPNSKEAIGSNMATKLVPPGDCYAVHSQLPEPLRIQASYFSDEWLKKNLVLGDPIMGEWPDVAGNDGGNSNRRGHKYSGAELGMGLKAVMKGKGRDWLEEALLEDEGIVMGNHVSRELQRMTKELYKWLREGNL